MVASWTIAGMRPSALYLSGGRVMADEEVVEKKKPDDSVGNHRAKCFGARVATTAAARESAGREPV